jgi:outer membrane protein TolC
LARRAAFFPRLALTASAATAGAGLPKLFAAGSGNWSFAPQLSILLLSAGALQGSLNLGRVQRDIRIATCERTSRPLSARLRMASRRAAPMTGMTGRSPRNKGW